MIISFINSKGQYLKSLITNKEYETIDISNLRQAYILYKFEIMTRLYYRNFKSPDK